MLQIQCDFEVNSKQLVKCKAASQGVGLKIVKDWVVLVAADSLGTLVHDGSSPRVEASGRSQALVEEVGRAHILHCTHKVRPDLKYTRKARCTPAQAHKWRRRYGGGDIRGWLVCLRRVESRQ